MEPTSRGEVYAELDIHSLTFPIARLQGREAVNSLFQFSLSFYTEEAINENQWLGQPAFLSIHHPQGLRRFKALVFKIKQHRLAQPHGYFIECELRPALILLSLNGRAQYHPESSLLQLIHRLFNAALEFEWIQPVRGLYRQTHWLQSNNENDLNFFQRVLASNGVNYLCNCSHESDADLIIFEDNMACPSPYETAFYWRPQARWSRLEPESLFDFSVKEDMAGHVLNYKSRCPNGQQDYIEATAGHGKRRSVFWGLPASSARELFQKARDHSQALTLQQKQFQAHSHRVCIAAGQHFEGRGFPKGLSSSHFLVLEVEHYFEQGQYKNRLTFVDERQNIRPFPIRLNHGQRFQVAQIAADQLNPLLDEMGRYGFQNYLYQYDKQQPFPRADRLTAYLEPSQDNSPSGLHFPLQAGADVLLLSLHGCPEQPLLQNSPANACNLAPVTEHNPWVSLLSTAWGQYLGFIEKTDKTNLCLSNASGRNALHFVDNDIELRSSAGFIQFHSPGIQCFQAMGKISFHIEKDWFLSAKQQGAVFGKSIHLQANKAEVESHRDVQAQANSSMEISGRQLTIDSGRILELLAENKDLQAELRQGEMAIEVDELILTAEQNLCIGSDAARIELRPDSLHFQAKKIQFDSQSLQWKSRVNYCPNATQAECIMTAFSLPALSAVKLYQHQQIKRLGAPEWGASFYHRQDTAQIQFEIAGFQGDETLTVFLYQADIADILHLGNQKPLIREIPTARLLESRSFTLSDDRINIEKDGIEDKSGQGRIKIDYPLQHLTDNEENRTVYFIRLQIAEVIGPRYSNPMMVMAAADIEIESDKGISFENAATMIELRRCLPSVLGRGAACPDAMSSFFYQPVIQMSDLPAGRGNRLSLVNAGEYQELFVPEKKPPGWQIPFEVDIAKKNHIKMKRLMPPMRINLHHAYLDEEGQLAFSSDDPQARAFLNAEELEYIKACQNHLTLFIHGYNVPYGCFGKHYSEESGLLTESRVDASIYRDEDYFSQLYEQLDGLVMEKENQLNGSGMHHWITHLEQNINRAAGMKAGDYTPFTRCLFIGWPGNPITPLGYNKSVRKAIADGPLLARLLENFHQQLPGIKLHVIAHSLGSGLLLQAMDCLGKKGKSNSLEHVFFCQPALPAGSLKTYGITTAASALFQQLKIKHQHNPWFCPFAHQASRYIQVFHSRNDNILGPMLSRENQPPGISRMDVLKKKPLDEILALLFARFTGTESIYMASNMIGQPVSELFHESGLQKAWSQIIKQYPCIQIAGKQEQCRPGLASQLNMLESMGIYVLFREQRIKRGLRHLLKAVKIFHQNKRLTEEKTAAPELLTSLSKMGGEASISKAEIDQYYRQHRGFIRQLLTFLQSIHLLEGALLEPAMGYVGADWKNDEILAVKSASGDLKNTDTTAFIWHHSNMNEVDKIIQDNFFRDGIIKAKEMKFIS